MKNLMLSTAILAAFAGAAVAQDAATGLFRTAPNATDIRASDFIGMRVYASDTPLDANEYNGTQDGWNDIGEINDVILSRDGRVDAVLVDIGGFLGAGERQVAVGMEAIRFVADGSTADAADDFFLVMSAARADLEGAPGYMMTPVAGSDAAATKGEAMADTQDPARTPMMRDGYVAAEAEYLTSEKLTGAKVYDANDEWIGDVSNLVLAEDGKITQAVVDVGGFLGMGEKPVALGMADVDILRAQAGEEVRVYLSKTKEELEAMPKFEG